MIAMPIAAEKSYSPYTDRVYPANLYWGDTHLHSGLSWDAYTFGTNITPDQAYRFAKGEEVQTSGGESVRIRRPLDFLMVADHAENLGIIPALIAGDTRIKLTAEAQEMIERLGQRPTARELLNSPNENKFLAGYTIMGMAKKITGRKLSITPSLNLEVWEGVVSIAEHHNNPGKFTTFAGYEYTSSKLGLHRNVMFADGPSHTLKTIPFSSYDSENPEDLWHHLEQYKASTGGDVISIPHNSNLSRGNMFKNVTYEGKSISSDYAHMRASIEPIIEVTQIKGDSETYPLVSPEDEFADHERSSLNVQYVTDKSRSEEDIARASYARSALQTGLSIESAVGTNPYKFGMIGSTDSHTGLASVDENNFYGKFGSTEPSLYRSTTPWLSSFSSSGYAAVWAAENTREAIFSAMKRREVYATTGPRITLRFFAGWNFKESHAYQPDIAKTGYRFGIPMGGDLTRAKITSDKAPTFLVRATKDPDGAALDRIQIVKGWIDNDGQPKEKVHNIAWSDDRVINSDGALPSVGSTINLAEATYQNSIGSPELSAFWSDENFDSTKRAFYYVRVLQIPTPRWTAYDAKFFDQEIPQDPLPVIEERAYSSPIWYTPP